MGARRLIDWLFTIPYGEDGFEFELLDRLPPSDDPGQDLTRDLQALLELWQERLQIATLGYS